MTRPTLQPFCTAGLVCMPLAAAAHLLDGSPDPLPRWVPIAGLIIAGVMGGVVGFAISKHRRSMEKKKMQGSQHTGEARASPAGGSPNSPSPPPETAP